MPQTITFPREVWEDPELPVRGPAPKGTPGTWVIHYPGSSSGYEPLTDAQVSSYLRAIQNDYENNTRGYSIGYSWGVAQSGSGWEIRGDDFNTAANPGRKLNDGNFNHVSKAIFVMVGHANPATPAAVAKINAIIATEPTWDVRIHGDVDWTSCCGAGLIAQVRAGIIGQQGSTIPPELPPDLPPVSGYNPPESWSLFPLDTNKPVVREGSTGDHVRYMQDVIFWYAGGDILVDGIFGPATKRRVIDVQRFVGGFPEPYCDGIVGNHETYPTWRDCFDYLVQLNMVPPPIEPPPESGKVEVVLPCKYMINQGDNPWSVSGIVYGKSTADNAALLDQSAFYMYSTPGHPAFVDTPGVNGRKTTVQTEDRGAWDVIRRLVPGVTDSEINNKWHPIFADWNGGWERVLHPGDVVHLPR